MRWILCGKNTAAIRCLEYLTECGDEVRVVGVAGDEGRDSWQRSLRAAAMRLGACFEQPPRINAPEVVDRLSAFGASALVSIQYDQILRGSLIRAIGCPCLNFHFALLPRNRGVAPIPWAILAGDSETGVTLHYMTEDIDAGDVIAQRAVPIGSGDTAREVYDRVNEATVALFRESYPFPEALLARRRPQNAARASYHRAGELDFARRDIHWDRPATELHRWMRAMIFPPLQYPETSLDSRQFAITRVAGPIRDAVTAPPGTVVDRSAAGLDVAAKDRSVRISGMIEVATPEASMDEIVDSIAVGDRLGAPVP